MLNVWGCHQLPNSVSSACIEEDSQKLKKSGNWSNTKRKDHFTPKAPTTASAVKKYKLIRPLKK
jgi:hypothetical protein